MKLAEEKGYTSAEVCRAVGLPRTTFDTWLLRRVLPLLPLGPGTGRSRSYSLLDAVRIAVAANLTRAHINIQTAGHVVGNIQDDHIDDRSVYPPPVDPSEEQKCALLLAPSPAAPARKEGDQRFNFFIGSVKKRIEHEEIDFILDHSFVGGRPETVTWVDITAVAARVRATLGHRADAPSDEDAAEVGFGSLAVQSSG